MCTSVERGSLEAAQAIKLIGDIFFNTSNRIYNLELSPVPPETPRQTVLSTKDIKISNVDVFDNFLGQNPSVKFLRLQWLDYTTTLRARVIPVRLAIDMFKNQRSIGISKAAFGLLQQGHLIPSFSLIGEYELIPCFESLRLAERDGYATVQGEFYEDGNKLPMCPRTALRRIVERGRGQDIAFLVGFELEFVFMTAEGHALDHTHSWSDVSSLRNPEIMKVIEEIVTALERSKIEVQQFHSEISQGQYEIVTGPLPPLEAVDTLLATRDTIYAVAERHGLKATFIPKPYPMTIATSAHVHMSMTPSTKYDSFYAGVLKHLRSILAFTYSNPSSYKRMQDSVWRGGLYVAWGTQNREMPLRKIEGSHWELKCMDGFANPYLAMAAILGAGVQGVIDGQSLLIKDCQVSSALLNLETQHRLGIKERLPSTLEEAIHYLSKDEELRVILGQQLVDTYITVKTAEMGMLNGMKEEERHKFLLKRY